MDRNDPRDIVDDSPITQQSSYEPASDKPGGEQSAGERAKNVATKAKEKAPEVMRKAQEQADARLDTAAEGMQSAASKIRERAQSAEGMPAEAGTKVADTMERTAGYLREHDTNEILDDMETYVREHPMQAVAGAVLGGFIIGRILK